jgi:hypothetical protein
MLLTLLAACSSGTNRERSAHDSAEVPAPPPLPVLGGVAVGEGPAGMERACGEGVASACAARAVSATDPENWRARACALGDRPSCDVATIERDRATRLVEAIDTARAAGPAVEAEEPHKGPRVWLQHIGTLDGVVASTGEIEPRFRNGLHRAYERCYRELARKDDPPSGIARISWTMESGGKLSNVKVLESFAPTLDDCLVRTTESWTFAALAPDRGARVVLTAVFEP